MSNLDQTELTDISDINISDNVQEYGLRDKNDMTLGLQQVNPFTVQKTQLEYTVIADTRDCVGTQSLLDAQAYAESIGIRDSASGLVLNTTGLGVDPCVITFDSVLQLKDNDIIYIKGVYGNTAVNGQQVISNIDTTNNTATILSHPNGYFKGSGTWFRPTDPGFPMTNDTTSIISGNTMTINLSNKLKDIKFLALSNITIPRDIIPLTVYISDFIEVSTNLVNVVYTGFTENNWMTYIPQEELYMTTRLLGFYSSPLDLYRSYINGAVSMQNQITGPPLQLWNPPLGPQSSPGTLTVDDPWYWPYQPISYPFQTVPTYVSNTFNVLSDTSGFLYYIVLSGYGVYDLLDWSVLTGFPATDALNTSIIRKLLLLLIVSKQSYNNQDYISLVLNSDTVSPNNLIYPYGYGSFQRFVPGPGIQLNYQPGLSDNSDPTIASDDSPIPFPSFRGNVWGPYNSPGDRFQKLSFQQVIQDLYLNGDLNNLQGNPIINPNVPYQSIIDDPSYGLDFAAQVEVNLGNITFTTNLNLQNAMRIGPNGFGAAVIRANGTVSGTSDTYVARYQQAGGQGPSSLDIPSAWANNGIYSENPTGIFTDPIAAAPEQTALNNTENTDPVPSNVDASYAGTLVSPIITHRQSYYDLGPNLGALIAQATNYIGYIVNDIPDTDLVIVVEEADRSIFTQSTNTFNSTAILDTPIRLSVGSTSGTQQYIESVATLVSSADPYCTNRFMIPRASLQKLHISFYTYDNTPIPLEQMLQTRRTLDLQRLTVEVINFLDIPNPFNLTYLFDPLNPQLIGRVKRYFQMIFKAGCYLNVAPGLKPESFVGLAGYSELEGSGVKPYDG